MDAPSELPQSNFDGAMQVRWANGPRKILQKLAPPIPPKSNEDMSGSSTGTTPAQFPSERSNGGTSAPGPWVNPSKTIPRIPRKAPTMTKESIDEAYVPVASRLSAARLCGHHTRHMEFYKDSPVKYAMHSHHAARSALNAGLPVTNPKGTSNQGLLNNFNVGYAKAHKKLTGKALGERGPLDVREHVFGLVKESTSLTTESNQEPVMTITEILSDIASGKTTAKEAAEDLASSLVERSLKPRALARFSAWGKQGNERYTRGDLPGGQTAEYQAANGTVAESAEDLDNEPIYVGEPAGMPGHSLLLTSEGELVTVEGDFSEEVVSEAGVKAAVHSGAKIASVKGLKMVERGTKLHGADYKVDVAENNEAVTGLSAKKHGITHVVHFAEKEHAEHFYNMKASQKQQSVLTKPHEVEGKHVVGFGHPSHMDAESRAAWKAKAQGGIAAQHPEYAKKLADKGERLKDDHEHWAKSFMGWAKQHKKTHSGHLPNTHKEAHGAVGAALAMPEGPKRAKALEGARAQYGKIRKDVTLTMHEPKEEDAVPAAKPVAKKGK
jgi:hypothetical protein